LKKKFEILDIPLGINEHTLIMITEIIVGMLPVADLIQDVKDSFLEPNKTFRWLARVMIPMDIMEVFGDCFSIASKLMQRTAKGRSIVTFINNAVDFVKFLGKGLFKAVMGIFTVVARTAKALTKYTMYIMFAIIGIFMALIMPVALIKIEGIIDCFNYHRYLRSHQFGFNVFSKKSRENCCQIHGMGKKENWS